MTLEAARALMTDEAIDKMRKVVSGNDFTINTSNKANNDILMQALCRAVDTGVIAQNSVDEAIVKLLNSATNTLSQNKLEMILTQVRKHQPDLECAISIRKGQDGLVKEWVFKDPPITFLDMFKDIIDHFKITPQLVRTLMTKTLKSTIVNNIAQLIAKYECKENVVISITTINRLVNMNDCILCAEFRNNKA